MSRPVPPTTSPSSAPDVRTQVLDAATRLFAARGYDGTSVQAVADEVGIRKASLLYHFPSKEELRTAVLDGLFSRWNDVFPRLLVAATAGEDVFDAVTREVVAFFRDDPNRARLVVRELLDRPEDMRDRIAADVSPWLDVLSKYLRKGQELGQVRADLDPPAYVVQTINLIVGGIAALDVMNSILPREGERDRPVRELLRMAHTSLFVDGAAPGPPRP